MREITYEQAALEALQEEFRRNPKTVHLATDPFPEMVREFGENRIRVTPICESTFVGSAIGLAGSGYRTVVNIRMATFGFVAADQFVNHMAKITYMFGGQAKFPILVRMTVGAGKSAAAQHSISPYAMYMQMPGLKLILPSTPYDIKGLFKTALSDNNPVICFEHMDFGMMKGEVPEEEYSIPFGRALVRKEGSDVTIVALARMVHLSMSVAAHLAREGISVEIIDPRTLMPLDKPTIFKSVGKTGRLVVADEACQTCSVASEIISLVVENQATFGRLKAAPVRVCGLDSPIPFSPSMEKYVIPDEAKLTRAVRGVMGGGLAF
jgi:pyruvate/2-oxoglutarate/acetoin dehydrogenase E1 component